MKNPSLEWIIDKDNPPKDNLSNAKMTFPSNPKTVRFVSPPATAQPLHSTTYSKNDDMLMNTAFKEDLPLMEWTSDNYVPHNNKENSPKVRKPSISISRTKIQQFVENLTNNSSSTIHTVNTDNSDNNNTITPSTTSVCKIREKRQKRNKWKARDQHTKHLERQVEELNQQLKEKQKQKEKEKITSELYESLEHSKQLETEKLEQLDDLIEEKEQDREERRRRQERNKIIDEKEDQWRKMMNKPYKRIQTE